jgi:hypothetical protein
MGPFFFSKKFNRRRRQLKMRPLPQAPIELIRANEFLAQELARRKIIMDPFPFFEK